MKPTISLLASALATIALTSTAAAQIAITEFLANPIVIADADGEFVELFNFSAQTVNLNGWTITDEGTDSDIISDTDLSMPAGSYLVIAKNKNAFETEFFDGITQPNVIEITALTLANSGDEIILSNANAQIVWSVAYPNGEGNGVAAFLTENVFTTTIWGSATQPGINFTELDPATDAYKPLALYDINKDPGEETNLLDSPEFAVPLRNLTAAFKEILARAPVDHSGSRTAGED